MVDSRSFANPKGVQSDANRLCLRVTRFACGQSSCSSTSCAEYRWLSSQDGDRKQTGIDLESSSCRLTCASANRRERRGGKRCVPCAGSLSLGRWQIDAMSAAITAFIQIDDNTPKDAVPFTNDPSTWDLSHDIGLAAGKHYDFYAAISGVRNQSGRQPLYACRGLPPSGCEMPDSIKELAGDHNVGWLTLSEIHAALQHMGVVVDELNHSVLLVLRTMACAEELHGRDRVRLVFQICD